MATQAENFESRMVRYWEFGFPDKESNATLVASSLGAVKLRGVSWDGFTHTPGDWPASLWHWPDESESVLLDDGSGVMGVDRVCDGE